MKYASYSLSQNKMWKEHKNITHNNQIKVNLCIHSGVIGVYQVNISVVYLNGTNLDLASQRINFKHG